MKTNAFYCPRCSQITRHCEITSREFSALEGDNALLQGLATWNDVSGMRALLNSVTGYHLWKCMSCGLATARNASGEIKNTALNS